MYTRKCFVKAMLEDQDDLSTDALTLHPRLLREKMGPKWVAMPLLKRGGQQAACHTHVLLLHRIVTPQVTSSHCTGPQNK